MLLSLLFGRCMHPGIQEVRSMQIYLIGYMLLRQIWCRTSYGGIACGFICLIKSVACTSIATENMTDQLFKFLLLITSIADGVVGLVHRLPCSQLQKINGQQEAYSIILWPMICRRWSKFGHQPICASIGYVRIVNLWHWPIHSEVIFRPV